MRFCCTPGTKYYEATFHLCSKLISNIGSSFQVHLLVPQCGLSLPQFAIKMTSLLKFNIISIVKSNKCKKHSTIRSLIEQRQLRRVSAECGTFHIETIHLICSTNQITGFFMKMQHSADVLMFLRSFRLYLFAGRRGRSSGSIYFYQGLSIQFVSKIFQILSN